METYKILVTSDLHLSPRIWKHRPIEGDSFYSWKQIQDIAISESVDCTILAGDLLDQRKNNSESIFHLLNGLETITDKNIPIIFCQGQHGMQEVPWPKASRNDLVHWVEDYPTTTHSLPLDEILLPNQEEITVQGFDFKDKETFKSCLEAANEQCTDILICHQVWEDFMGTECNPQAKFADVKCASILITGDYHEAICQDYDGLTVISPGSTHLRSISEPVDKSVYLLEVQADEKSNHFDFSCRAIPLKTRRRFEIDATNKDIHQIKSSIEGWLGICRDYAAEEGLPELLKKPLMRLIYEKSNPDVAAAVQDKFGEDCHLFYKVINDKSEEPEAFEMRQHTDAADRVSMASCLEHYVDKDLNSKTYALANKLLESVEPGETLAKWIKEETNEN